MRKDPNPAATPAAYVRRLSGWRRELVDALRAAARSSKALEEAVKWGHLVYSLPARGPVLLIRAEPSRVLFGFWRGQRLLHVEPRLRPGGQYEMATLDLREGDTVGVAVAKRLVKEAVALNVTLGDPTRVARRDKARR